MEVNDIDLSLRFKHGIHTVFLFVDPSKTFNSIAKDLLEALNARYESGLSTSVASPDKTKLPSDHSQIKFALPKIPTDLSRGWIPLEVGETDTPASKGIKDNSVIAFAFCPEGADESYEPEFTVDFPSFDEDMEGQ
ncbi:uncharacterized protein F4812DRAFT_443064 [Daldinia caldariorum]|uniref:uncharacterized protein n=1 Tax=Daldinia caldariorum TaxID=326644 RepID=UPI002007BA5C|nr:uncharacterized protein F4812DRAFT_443064 [Daldinia caldariorum]KAI1464341.1 hypothetical protein F4812DRAFT_443064 [Daldinia caldariorum]